MRIASKIPINKLSMNYFHNTFVSEGKGTDLKGQTDSVYSFLHIHSFSWKFIKDLDGAGFSQRTEDFRRNSQIWVPSSCVSPPEVRP